MGKGERFLNLFEGIYKPIIGMLHLSGDSRPDRISRALREADIYEQEGVNGAIVENYHGDIKDVQRTLEALSKQDRKLVIGINVLPNEYQWSIPYAIGRAKFVQLDAVAGTYKFNSGSNEGFPAISDMPEYERFRQRAIDNNIAILGGVWPKYYYPIRGSNLKRDIKEGMERCDAIVVTGEGTGIETPLEKVQQFKCYTKLFPLIIGAGLTVDNLEGQLNLAYGAIVGSFFKPNKNTHNEIDPKKVRDFMQAVTKLREMHIFQ